MNKLIKSSVILSTSVLISFGLQSPASAKISPGCTASQPTFIGGTIEGYPDGRAVNSHTGVSVGYHDAKGKLKIVMPDGSPNTSTQGDYSFVNRLNPDLPPSGGVGEKKWGMCVWGGVTTFFTESYPKEPSSNQLTQPTNKSRYGASAYYSGTVTSGQTVNLLLRLPVTFEGGGGNTGGVQGYVTYKGNYVPAQNVTSVRAFPGPGSNCGVEGYSAAADQLGSGTNPNRTYFKMSYLAGGQCGLAAQTYSFQVTCSVVCGATNKTFIRNISIKKGITPRFDVAFT